MKREKFETPSSVFTGPLTRSTRAIVDRKELSVAPRYELPASQIRYLSTIPYRVLKSAAGAQLFTTRHSRQQIAILTNGWLARTQLIGSDQRQITDILLPGDMILLHKAQKADDRCRVETVTDASLRLVDIDGTVDREGLTDTILRIQEIDLRELRETLAAVGSLSAVDRLRNILGRIDNRLRDAYAEGPDNWQFQLTQKAIADLAGLSLVHTNKSLKQLRAAGELSLEKTKLTMLINAQGQDRVVDNL